jgi:hypothetical protein
MLSQIRDNQERYDSAVPYEEILRELVVPL